jgi:hypothetical protein
VQCCLLWDSFSNINLCSYTSYTHIRRIWLYSNTTLTTQSESTVNTILHYITNKRHSYQYADLISHGNKKIANTCNTKFLGITLDNTLSWKTHIDTIIPKLSSACFVIRSVKPFLSQESLKMLYYSYFHSIIMYGLIFWGNAYYSNTIFRLQRMNY